MFLSSSRPMWYASSKMSRICRNLSVAVLLFCYKHSSEDTSLVPRHLRRGRRNTWYTPFAHVLISKPISKNLWAIGYSGNLLCNSDVTSLKFLLPQVVFPLWRQQRSEVRPSLMQSPALSNSCKYLMSLLNPSSDRLWRPYMTGTMFSCGYLPATVKACVSKLYHSSWTSSGVS